MGILKHIPNTITSGNLFCGSLGVIFTFQERFDIAFMLMLGAAVCDFFDGFSARMLGAYSPMGKELDSLADDISFGLLPALMLFKLGPETGIIRFIPLMIAVFSALRLAKFNIDERQSENFIGLATPASAMICGAIACYVCKEPASVLYTLCKGNIFIPCISLVLCALLVCEVPMFSMKFKKGAGPSSRFNKLRIIFGVCALASLAIVAILGLHWSMAVATTFTTYILINLGNFILESLKLSCGK